MLEIKLAFKNLLGAGLRTWLNVIVLSIAFVIILFYNGMLDGWNEQARRDTCEWEIGSGEIRHPLFDPYDPYCYQDAHKAIDADLQKLINAGEITPILVTQASIYPQGRMQNIVLKGISPDQKLLKLPSDKLNGGDGDIKAIIGHRMANASNLKIGDRLMVRWRDVQGAFDAKEIVIADIFRSNVPAIDAAQIWVSIDVLQEICVMPNEATYFVVNDEYLKTHREALAPNGWKFASKELLLKDLNDVIKSKKASSGIMYGLLLAIALLAIFDTQVLSIFRRQKEIGTYIALGMTRFKVVRIFTFEGTAHSILAILLGSIYGTPVLSYFVRAGIPMPSSVDQTGLAISASIYPVFSLGLIVSSILLVVISAMIVSYIPTRKITKLNPTDAIKGKIL
ncbi:MAG: ABC transporter permease [Ignavibacteria bacterium GWF2_33_9]|nr:MAG: ABC transporter permease [Ignavibacteria bacterium GWF2_33_9]